LRYGQMLSLLGEGIPGSGYHSTNGCHHACIKGLGSGCNFFCGFGGHSFVHSHRAGQLFIGQTDSSVDFYIGEGGVDYTVVQTESQRYHADSAAGSGDSRRIWFFSPGAVSNQTAPWGMHRLGPDGHRLPVLLPENALLPKVQPDSVCQEKSAGSVP